MHPLDPTGDRGAVLQWAGELMAQHIGGSVVGRGRVDLGHGDPVLMIGMDEPLPYVGGFTCVPLYVWLEHPSLGDQPVPCQTGGYGTDRDDAVREGICSWARCLGPVLTLGPRRGPALVSVVGGRRVQVVQAVLDRGFSTAPPTGSVPAAQRLRREGSLVDRFLASALVPPLPEHTSVVEVFVQEAGPGRRFVDIKVQGVEVQGGEGLVASTPPGPEGEIALLRELALVTPL